MRRFLFLIVCFFSCSVAFGLLPKASEFGDGFDIRLQEAVYGDGTIKTDQGGIIKAKDLFLQAQVIEYTRIGEGNEFVHTIKAKDRLFVTYKGRSYKGDRAEIDLTTGKLTVWNGITRIGPYFIGGSVIEVTDDGVGMLTDAYVTTSENERSDWSIHAGTATIDKDSTIHVSNATFRFVNMPVFWVPYFSTDLLHADGDPLRYRVRWGGNERLRFGASYRFSTGPVKNRALLDYSIKNGLGTGVRSLYRSSDSHAAFDALNYVAQGKERSWDSARYRLEGCYRDYFEAPNLTFRLMYDKLSDREMKDDFADHAVSDVRAGLTEATLWREEADWKTSLNGRVRINNFQTIKQELPLLSFNQRPFSLGSSRCILYNSFSTGYLNYVYARNTPSVHNFASTRTELDQTLYATYPLYPISVTPTIGYRLIQYSSSPQNTSRLQAIGVMGLGAKTRFVNSSSAGQQIVEPYVQELSYTRPPVRADRAYIFDLEDGWTQMNMLRYGIRHNWYLPFSTGSFTPKLYTDLYSRSFFASHHLPRDPYKIWLTSTIDATSRMALKLDSAWDTHRHLIDHVNIGTRTTLSKTLALVVEWRQRSSYAWRKVDSENFVVDAVRSSHRLRHSEMSDNRKTVLASLCWSPTRTFDLDFTSYFGFRKVHPRRYMNYEMNATMLVRGALRITLTFFHRPGGPTNGFYFTCALGPKREGGSTAFRKIGDGNYDIW